MTVLHKNSKNVSKLNVDETFAQMIPMAQSTNTPKAKNGCKPKATGINAAE